MTPPVVVHVGYHKTATTWLQREIFPRHPALRSFVRRSPHGEAFLAEVIGRSDRRFDPARARAEYEARVAELDVPAGGTVVISAERLSGSAATGGFDTIRIARRLQAALPDARILMGVREQVAMIASEYRQLVLEGSSQRLPTLLRRGPTWAASGFDLEHYEYDLLADEYARLFGRERVMVFGFEALGRDQRGFLADLAAFLGIPPWTDVPDAVLVRRVNTGAALPLLRVRRVLNAFTRSHLNPDPVIAIPAGWRSPLAAVAARLPAPRRPLIDDATAQQLRERYAESNARLATAYGVHLV